MTASPGEPKPPADGFDAAVGSPPPSGQFAAARAGRSATLHPDLKTARVFPGPLYFLSFATTSDLLVYAVGSLAAMCTSLPFISIDLTYGHWTSALVPVVGVATPENIRAVSREVALISIGTTLGMLIFAATFYFCFGLASARVTARMRYAYLAAVLSQPATYFETVGSGEVASRMSRDIVLVSTGVGEKLGFAFWSVGAIITGVIVSVWAAPRIGGVLFSILPFCVISFGLAGWLASAASARISKAEGDAATFLEQVLSSCRTVKVLKAQDALVAVYDKYLETIEKDGSFLAVSEGVTYGVSYFGVFTAYSLAFWYGGQRVAFHGQDTGRLVTSFFSIFNALFAVVNLLPHLLTLSEAIKAQGRIKLEIERLSSIDPRSEQGLTTFETLAGEKPNGIGRHIEVRNVTFEFPSRPGMKALDDVSLTIERGKVTALVGHSGSGKSTVTALLLRQYDLAEPASTTSNIFMDGVPISALRTSFLRQQIAMVSQDPMLSTGTVLDNVAAGLTGTPYERLIDGSNDAVVRELCQDALEKAQAWDFVSRLPDGIDSVVSGARTGVLSGGQRQRLAVARALVRKASILVIDEGTSALDSSSEALLMMRIAKEQRDLGMTVILIAHRLSTVKHADTIYVMGAGHVLEQGNHQSLEAAHGEYWKMLQLSQGILLDDEEDTSAAGPVETDAISLRTSVTASLSNVEGVVEKVVNPVLIKPATRSPEAEEAEIGLATEGKNQPSRLRSFLSYPLRRRRWLIPGVLSALCIGAAFPLSGWLLGKVVHAFDLPEPNEVSSRTRFFALMFTVIAIACALISLVEAWCLVNGAQRVTRELRREGAHAVLRQDIAWFEGPDQGAGALTAAIGKNPSEASVPLGMVGGQAISSSANFLGSLILGFVLSWALLLVGLAPLLLLAPIAYYEIKFGAMYEEEAGKPIDRAASFGSEAVDSIKTVAAFGQELQILRTLTKLSEPNHKQRNRLAFAAALFFGLSQAIPCVIVALIYFYGGKRYADGSDDLTTVYALFEACMIASFALSRIFSFSGDFSRSVHGFKSISAWKERRPAFATLAPKADAQQRTPGRGPATIEIENLTFAYPSRPGKLAISDLSLTIRAGEKLALCGPSGGGKSSVLACIARFYEPTSGTVKVSGVDVRSLSLDEHWGSIALVAQDASLYGGTVRFNLTLGLPYKATDAQIQRACEQARIWEFIQTLDNGVDTELGLKGLNLSGGQRQRLCIARALLREAKILLLDEATSALDNESESLVQEALDRASIGRTTVVIAHRLSTIRNASRIAVVEEGRIVEIGSHEELMRKAGRYVDLIAAQL